MSAFSKKKLYVAVTGCEYCRAADHFRLILKSMRQDRFRNMDLALCPKCPNYHSKGIWSGMNWIGTGKATESSSFTVILTKLQIKLGWHWNTCQCCASLKTKRSLENNSNWCKLNEIGKSVVAWRCSLNGMLQFWSTKKMIQNFGLATVPTVNHFEWFIVD